VERQLEINIGHAQEHGYSYVVFTDRKSAYRREVVRKDYMAVLDAIRARRIKRVIVYKIDRLYRQVEELMDVIKIADRGRIPLTVIGVDDEDVFDLTTAKGCDEAIGRVLEAQRESRRTSERVRNQCRKAREQGIPSPGPAAFGWRDKFHHDETKAEVLRQAYRSFLHGSSLKAIGDRWHEAGLKGARRQ
jgi:site-specific DNA recombinase